jgi:NAD(P)-dependent dehydrogenase (short-subunit alcohol dehydrogenase family)
MSTFDATSTTDDVLDGIDLTGRRFLVTGASGGLGLETARALASRGAAVVMAARDEPKNAAAMDAIWAVVPDADLSSLTLDLASLDSVRTAAATFLADPAPLHGLILNAGVMATPFEHTADGFERQLGTNHLGHFLLSVLLADRLVASAPSRVVMLSSAGHKMGDVDLDDPNFERRHYDPFVSYGQSKTANVLHAVGFDARYGDQGVRAFAVHPGGIHTELGRYMDESVIAQLLAMVAEGETGGGFRWKSVPEGAATSVWAATSPDLDGRGGLYCEDCQVSPVIGADGDLNDVGVLARAVDPATAEALWTLSERLVGLTA